MTQTILFDPLIPFVAIWVLAALSGLGVLFAALRGLSGWALRGLAALVLIAALTGPVYQTEDRSPLDDIVLVLSDQTASQQIASRPEQMQAAQAELRQMLDSRPGTEVRWIDVADGEGDGGTQVMTALTAALAQEPRGRIAGIIALSDGQVHDADLAPVLPAPMHLLQTGRATDWDRRLIVRDAPGFAIIGESISLTLRIEDQGAAPAVAAGLSPIEISINGAPAQQFALPVGADISFPITLSHGGRNVVQFTIPDQPGELTGRNNTALVQINGVRDRLRVLLVSGEPHPGGRTWRNLLKSDSSVDLVHFTILRPPEKQDGVPVDELSLIAFPTRELFLEKISDFDLIIFDRYKRRGILPSIYLDNVAKYVTEGGAVLVAAGPDFATADSIYRSPLSTVLPARPSARVLEQPYRPAVTDLGQRHPVTADLPDPDNWGRWQRQIEVENPEGHVVMSGLDDRPLLVLNRVGLGRVALLASDHAWLWSRGYEGGGPQLELLRRLAHWMMKEPELEEDALWAEAIGQRMRIMRRSLADEVAAVTITHPDGSTHQVTLDQIRPGHWETQYDGPDIGLYRLEDGTLSAVIGLGPAAPREFEETIATDTHLQPAVAALRGGIFRIEDGLPSLRNVRLGRPAAGRGWLGLTPRDAYETLSVRRLPLLPPWLVLVLATGFVLGGWLREGRS